ncbi:MAG: DUF47 family protein [Candidatus Cloacimonetes bacterium]|nr:DUF47 family protein [Candidatus Cloacimonadota bacterium]
MKHLFDNKTKILVGKIDEYLDMVAKAGIIFYEGVRAYMAHDTEAFTENYTTITSLESKADILRRAIKKDLYTYMLIPEARGDVLGLIETLDDIVNICEKVLKQFSIERPEIRDYMTHDFIELARYSKKSVEKVVIGAGGYFKKLSEVADCIGKVYEYEHLADGVEERLKRKLFSNEDDLHLSYKLHIRYFIEKIVLVSDVAETVADRLGVYAIKRQI